MPPTGTVPHPTHPAGIHTLLPHQTLCLAILTYPTHSPVAHFPHWYCASQPKREGQPRALKLCAALADGPVCAQIRHIAYEERRKHTASRRRYTQMIHPPRRLPPAPALTPDPSEPNAPMCAAAAAHAARLQRNSFIHSHRCTTVCTIEGCGRISGAGTYRVSGSASSTFVCVGIGGVVFCLCVCACDLLIYLYRKTRVGRATVLNRVPCVYFFRCVEPFSQHVAMGRPDPRLYLRFLSYSPQHTRSPRFDYSVCGVSLSTPPNSPR